VVDDVDQRQGWKTKLILVLTNGDATLRIWRSAWAWMPINRGRGLFRLTWVVGAVIGLTVIATAAAVVLWA